MAIIYTYPQKNKLVDADSVVITDSEDRNMTKQLNIGVIMAPVYALQEEVKIIQKQITEIFETISVIEEQIAVIEQEIAQLQKCCAENAENIAVNTVNINNNTAAIEDLQECCDDNSSSINELSAQLSAFIKNQTVINQTLQAEIDACCGSGEPKIKNVTPISNADEGGTFDVVITGEATSWLTDEPTDIICNLPGEFTINSFEATSDTSITFNITLPEGSEANGGYDVSVVAGDSSAACTGCWSVTGKTVGDTYRYDICPDQCDVENAPQLINLERAGQTGEAIKVLFTESGKTAVYSFTGKSKSDPDGEITVITSFVAIKPESVCSEAVSNGLSKTICYEFNKCQEATPKLGQYFCYSTTLPLDQVPEPGQVFKVEYNDGTNSEIACYTFEGNTKCAAMLDIRTSNVQSFLTDPLENGCDNEICGGEPPEECPYGKPKSDNIVDPDYDKAVVGENYQMTITTNWFRPDSNAETPLELGNGSSYLISWEGDDNFNPLIPAEVVKLENGKFQQTWTSSQVITEEMEGKPLKVIYRAFNCRGESFEEEELITWDVTVVSAPKEFKITSTPSTEGKVGEEYVYNIVTVGGDGGVKIQSGESFPSWATLIDSGNGTASITGTPPEGSEGETFNFEIIAVDTNGNTSTQDWTVTISGSATPKPPEIISTPSTKGAVGSRYEYIIQAINCFEISNVSLPPWATLVPGEAPCQGTITGTPPEDSAGRKYSFEITITGANGVTATQSWAVTVD